MLCAPSPNLVFWKVSVQKYKEFSVKKSDKFSSWPLKILSQEFWNPHCQFIFKKSLTVCVAGRGLWLPSQEFGSLIKSLNAAPHVFFLQKMRHTGFWSFVQKQRWIENSIRYELAISLKSGLLFEILLDQSLVTVWALTKVLLACSHFQLFF